MDYNYLVVISLYFQGFLQLTQYKNYMEFHCCGDCITFLGRSRKCICHIVCDGQTDSLMTWCDLQNGGIAVPPLRGRGLNSKYNPDLKW